MCGRRASKAVICAACFSTLCAVLALITLKWFMTDLLVIVCFVYNLSTKMEPAGRQKGGRETAGACTGQSRGCGAGVLNGALRDGSLSRRRRAPPRSLDRRCRGFDEPRHARSRRTSLGRPDRSSAPEPGAALPRPERPTPPPPRSRPSGAPGTPETVSPSGRASAPTAAVRGSALHGGQAIPR